MIHSLEDELSYPITRSFSNRMSGQQPVPLWCLTNRWTFMSRTALLSPPLGPHLCDIPPYPPLISIIHYCQWSQGDGFCRGPLSTCLSLSPPPDAPHHHHPHTLNKRSTFVLCTCRILTRKKYFNTWQLLRTNCTC